MLFTSSLIRRFAAIVYDLLLLASILFVATALVLPFNAGQAFEAQIFYLLYLLIISFIFYGWFWTHGGQTLGLRAWKLQVLTFDSQSISWLQAFWRFSLNHFIQPRLINSKQLLVNINQFILKLC